ncbi:FG-GAP repeat domain-containing protein [Streptomyces sp. NRRL S-340]|uniref:FG-GAP repeat domain-containing protein n=1 Tax=Streptomyces sp. NRRL S-340 TaxID=1463901 RepID=UPI000B066F1F|nr:VCBS repeat-containing protein [Streptomyces sp. NRRL S-340]
MQRSRTRRLWLTAATGSVLATGLAGAQAMAVPATAPATHVSAPRTAVPPTVPLAVSAPGAAGAPALRAAVPYPAGRTRLVSVGSTGFLTWNENLVRTWTSFADGATTDLTDSQSVPIGSQASDIVLVNRVDGFVEVRDMAAKSTVMSLGPSELGPQSVCVGGVGTTVFVRTPNSAGGQDVHLVAMKDHEVTRRAVTGLPQDAKGPYVAAATRDHAVLVYETSHTWQWAVVDVAAGAVVQRHDMASSPASVAVSPTHVAWSETDSGGKSQVVTAPRGTGKDMRLALGRTGGKVVVGLVGGWVTYGMGGAMEASEPNALYALTARSLTTNASRRLLDHVEQTAAGPDGTLYASGGTVASGEGLYRIVPGADKAPVVTRAAGSGEPTKVTLLGHSVPAVVDLDRSAGRARLQWRLSRNDVAVTVTLRNTRTGETKRDTVYPRATGSTDPHRVTFDWDGDVQWHGAPDAFTGAGAGPYTWRIDAEPLNGIGPHLVASGPFTVARKPGLHDYDADGSPDVLARDTSGRLWIMDTYDVREYGDYQQNSETLVGRGWNVYDRIEAAGDLGGARVSDLVARDRSGVLWLYPGTGDAKAPFARRVEVGGGWNAYTRLTGGSDLNGDGRSDLVAVDASGALWLYKGTGKSAAPFARRVRVGTGGWGAYTQVTAVGDIAGGSAGDLVARDRAGVLWLYLGRGDGTLAPRTRIGGGWNTYARLLGIGDADFDGRPDLYATRAGNGQDAYVYRSSGRAGSPFAARARVVVFFMQPRTYDLFS